ncbi:unnamed protein product [Cylicostephanus goldi]|uniref:Uncharacterized protein n=1 Tax=Cylicostephanus goldi TaxID=71465 RepID=A0A3P6UT38_CYLGO|nr:unnamed protein product [Cylicostephanus goldi]
MSASWALARSAQQLKNLCPDTQQTNLMALVPVFHKTSEVAAATADTVKHKWNDMRNSSLFKSFESKLGTAYNSVSPVFDSCSSFFLTSFFPFSR